MPRRLRVEADGGSRGNPGVAGYGALVRDEDGTLLAERAAPLGKASNNVAEYQGMIAGLTAAIAIDPAAEITVAMDSKLVVEQMSGRWKIKHEDMRRLALEARDLVAQATAAGGRVRFEWIPRKRNGAADKLSNDGMDGTTVYRDHDPDGPAAAVDPDPGSTSDSRPAGDPDAGPARMVLIVLGGREPARSAELTRALCRPTALIVGGDPGVVPGAAELAVELDVDARTEPRLADPATAGAAYADLVAQGGDHVLVVPVAVLRTILADLLGTDLEHARRIALAPGALTGIEAWPDGRALIAFVNRA